MIAPILRTGRHASRVGACLRLRYGEGPQHLPAGQRNQKLPFLFFASELENRVGGEVRHRHRHRRGGAGGGDLLKSQGVAHRPGPRAAVFDGKHHPHQAEAAHFPDRRFRENLIAIPCPGKGLQLPLREIPGHQTDHLLFRGQLESHCTLLQGTYTTTSSLATSRFGLLSLWCNEELK